MLLEAARSGIGSGAAVLLCGTDAIAHFLPALTPRLEPLVLKEWGGRRAIERFHEDECVSHNMSLC